MRARSLIRTLALSCGLLVLVASSANAAKNDHIIYTPARGSSVAGGMNKSNLVNHGGPVIVSAKVVFIFWGPTFAVPGPDQVYAQTLQAFRNQFGTTSEYKVITQYSGIMPANLGTGTPDWFDVSVPPVAVTDADVQAEVNAYLANHPFNASTIYEVVIPSTSYSSNGTIGSCGAPLVRYCAYHSWIGSGASAIKYSIQPYASCSACKVAGVPDVANQERFVCHETREAVTDPVGTAWYDTSGNEADDKCNGTFVGTGSYFYQTEWSNLVAGCVKF